MLAFSMLNVTLLSIELFKYIYFMPSFNHLHSYAVSLTVITIEHACLLPLLLLRLALSVFSLPCRCFLSLTVDDDLSSFHLDSSLPLVHPFIALHSFLSFYSFVNCC